MGFRFGLKKKSASSGESHASEQSDNTNNNIKNIDAAAVDVLSHPKATETKLLSRRQKLLKRVVGRHKSMNKKNSSVSSGLQQREEDKSITASDIAAQTPRNATMAQTTPRTTMTIASDPDAEASWQQRQQSTEEQQQQQQKVHSRASDKEEEIYLDDPNFSFVGSVVGDGDATASVLEEREVIRQQLFYEEQGVEVTAQFRSSSNNNTHHTLSERTQQQQSPQQQQQQQHTRAGEQQHEEEKKEDEPLNSETPVHLPPIPVIEPAEVDPATHFPAVTAAVAAANASRPRPPPIAVPRPQSTVTAATDLTSPSASAPAPEQATAGGCSIANLVTPATPSPEKPFDEQGQGPEDPTICEIERAQSMGAETAYSEEDEEDEAMTMASTAAHTYKDDNEQQQDVTKKLLDVFNCGDDFTEFSGTAQSWTGAETQACRLVDAFYDNTCWTYREAATMQRPFYDENFAVRFLKVSFPFVLQL